MDLKFIIIIVALFVGIGFLFKYIPAPWNWILAVVGCVILMIAAANMLGVVIH